MLSKILSNKWMSLFCTFVNSCFANLAWNSGDYWVAFACFALAFYCAYNFMTGVKEDYYGQDRKQSKFI